MASDILSNSYLNLNQKQAEILLEMILTGSKMANGVRRLDATVAPQELVSKAKDWLKLISRLGESFV